MKCRPAHNEFPPSEHTLERIKSDVCRWRRVSPGLGSLGLRKRQSLSACVPEGLQRRPQWRCCRCGHRLHTARPVSGHRQLRQPPDRSSTARRRSVMTWLSESAHRLLRNLILAAARWLLGDVIPNSTAAGKITRTVSDLPGALHPKTLLAHDRVYGIQKFRSNGNFSGSFPQQLHSRSLDKMMHAPCVASGRFERVLSQGPVCLSTRRSGTAPNHTAQQSRSATIAHQLRRADQKWCRSPCCTIPPVSKLQAPSNLSTPQPQNIPYHV